MHVIRDTMSLVETLAGEPVATASSGFAAEAVAESESFESESFETESLETESLETESFGTEPLVLVEGDVDDDEQGWQELALCAQTDPEAFFPEKGGSTREAKRICSGCEVRAECLDYALGHDERFGIWGGLSERERRRLRRVI